MSTPDIHFEGNLIAEYEILRAQILSAGISCPLSRNDHRIISEGLFQWVLGKQPTQQETTVAPNQEATEISSSASGGNCLEVGVINLIASMAIQSITRNQRVA